MATAAVQEQPGNAAISSLLAEIPVKLRCTICSELARGASRLPCCEQSICESCRSNLPNVCPVCDHSPLSAGDCKPNSTLRTTVTVFLRTAEKRLLTQKLLKEKFEAQPLEPESGKPEPARASPMINPLTPPQEADDTVRSEGQQDSTSVVKTEQPVETASSQDSTPATGQKPHGQGDEQHAWFGSDAAPMGGMHMFPGHVAGMPWGDYGMQGGWANGYGNIMGYPMNMNQLALAAQGGGFGVGNYGNMGMNGTAGFNNGQEVGIVGWNGGWNGQNNVGFNPGMDATRNGGFYSATPAGGYNHQSHGHHQMPAQQYHNHHFPRQQPYQRGRGGGYVGGGGGGGGGQRQISLERQQQGFEDVQFQQQMQGVDQAVAAVAGTEKKGEKIPSIVSEDPDNIADTNDVPTDSASTIVAGAIDTTEDFAVSFNSTAPVNPDMAPQHIPTDEFRAQGFQQQQSYPGAFNGNRGGFGRGGFRGGFVAGSRGGGHVGPIPSVAGNPETDRKLGGGLGVEGAPTAPKALRERGLSRGIPSAIRAGYAGRRGGYPGSAWATSTSPGHEYSGSRSPDSRHDRSRDRGMSRDRSRDRRRSIRSRSRSRHRKPRSPSAETNDERPRGRTPKRETEDGPPAVPAEVKDPIERESERDGAPNGAQEPTPRAKRSRDEVSVGCEEGSLSRSRSRSVDRHHKRNRRSHRRRSHSAGSRSRSGRHHRRVHKHKSSSKRHRHSRSRSRPSGKDRAAGKEEDLPGDGVDVTDADTKSRRESRERRRKYRSGRRDDRRDDSRHRSHRHGRSSRHDRDRRERHDRKEKPGMTEATSATPAEKKPDEDRYRRPADKDRDFERKSRRDPRSTRKLSYKYEDEEDLERQAERDREAERWGIK